MGAYSYQFVELSYSFIFPAMEQFEVMNQLLLQPDIRPIGKNAIKKDGIVFFNLTS
jgi:hypothetical protein